MKLGWVGLYCMVAGGGGPSEQESVQSLMWVATKGRGGQGNSKKRGRGLMYLANMSESSRRAAVA